MNLVLDLDETLIATNFKDLIAGNQRVYECSWHDRRECFVLRPGVESLLEEARRWFVRIILITHCDLDRAFSVLESADILHHFDSVYGNEDIEWVNRHMLSDKNLIRLGRDKTDDFILVDNEPWFFDTVLTKFRLLGVQEAADLGLRIFAGSVPESSPVVEDRFLQVPSYYGAKDDDYCLRLLETFESAVPEIDECEIDRSLGLE